MERYRNLSGDSGVEAYVIDDHFIAVRFNTGVTYWYTDASVGSKHVVAMKRLALQGQGLSTYISTHPDVRKGYAKKESAD